MSQHSDAKPASAPTSETKSNQPILTDFRPRTGEGLGWPEDQHCRSHHHSHVDKASP